ncbi:MAG: transcription antitermination factor NusB [Bryobacteraceae bacterium]
MTARPFRHVSLGRSVAFEALLDVQRGAYASDTLRARTQLLDPRDAGLASQIVFGTLRHRAQLDYLIQHYSGKTPRKLDREVREALRIGIFQLRYLERLPSHAVVHESVELVKATKRSASGFANAVLRKVTREAVEWPDRETELSCPGWLLDRWSAHFGDALAQGIAVAALAPPQPYVRIAPGSSVPPNLIVERTDVPGCYRLCSPPDPTVPLHDISSQSILPLLDLQPRQTYLDVCSAPGNKTRQALETPLSLAVACDISHKRLRASALPCASVVLDGRRSLPFSSKFDRIFIDAPCSGTGTIGRNPEIKWRVQPTEFARFGQDQFELLSRAMPLLAPGGKLLYATCSLEQEENEDVIRRFCAATPNVRLEREAWRIPGREEGDGFYAALLSRTEEAHAAG